MLEALIVGANRGVAEVVLKSLQVRPRSRFEQAILDGRAWSWASLTYDPDALDTILAVRNEDPARTLVVQSILFSSDTASEVVLWCANGDAITMAGTAVTGVLLKRESAGLVARATASADETGNGEAAIDYPGLLERFLAGANATHQLNRQGAIRLPYRHMLGADLTVAATAANVAVFGYNCCRWYPEGQFFPGTSS
jgi:hypothetical protein